MAKSISVRWNGHRRDDPDSIVQNGVEFVKGEWAPVPLPADDDLSPNAVRDRAFLNKLKGNPWFEVRGDKDYEQPDGMAATVSNPPPPAVARAPLTEYRVQARNVIDAKGKVVTGKKDWIVVNSRGDQIGGDDAIYADEESAKVVVEALNTPK